LNDEELSIGDYVLTGGELAALVIVDAVCRLLPGVLGCEDSATNDSFSCGLLKHGQYTRPRVFEGAAVPDILLSGDHAAIREWRLVAAVRRTLERRPELLAGITFDQAEKKLLARHGLLAEIEQRGGIFPAAGRKGRGRD
jgi:tRNA (guanine37-N1)-methyltransferase